VDLLSDDADESCEFGVPAEVVRGFGSAAHLYPERTVSSPSDLLRTPDGEARDPAVHLASDVTWYTRPRADL
jgi:hypothetical protein